jgi:hypothetical protein
MIKTFNNYTGDWNTAINFTLWSGGGSGGSILFMYRVIMGNASIEARGGNGGDPALIMAGEGMNIIYIIIRWWRIY